MGKLSGTMQCIKYMLFILNFMFLMVGVLLITVGVAVITNYNDFEVFLESPHFKPAEILIACGAILLFVSLVGCIGAIKLSTIMVNMYALLLFILLIMEIAGAITAFAMRCTIRDDIENSMMDALHNYKKYDYARNTWDFTQENLYCCGVHHPHNWASEHVDGHTVTMNGVTFTVPYSCCEDKEHCRTIYERGCLDVFGRYATDVTLLLVYIGIGTCVIQLLSAIFACTLAKGIRRAKTEMEMERQQHRQRIYEQTAGSQRFGLAPPYLHVSSATEA